MLFSFQSCLPLFHFVFTLKKNILQFLNGHISCEAISSVISACDSLKELTPKSEKPNPAQVYKVPTTALRCKVPHWYSEFQAFRFKFLR